jgi:methyl-accepting chemotaxis protein
MLTSGSIVEGKAIVEDIGEIILNELGTGNVQKLMASITNLANNLNIVLNDNKAEVNQLLKEFAESGGDASLILSSLKEFIQNSQVKDDIKSTIKYSSKSAKKINEIVGRKEIGEIITSTPQGLNTTVKSIESVSKQVSKSSEHISKITENIPETNRTINEAIKTYDCLGKGLSDMLSKRFLIFKLFFGAPGNTLEKCKYDNCYK